MSINPVKSNRDTGISQANDQEPLLKISKEKQNINEKNEIIYNEMIDAFKNSLSVIEREQEIAMQLNQGEDNVIELESEAQELLCRRTKRSYSEDLLFGDYVLASSNPNYAPIITYRISDSAITGAKFALAKRNLPTMPITFAEAYALTKIKYVAGMHYTPFQPVFPMKHNVSIEVEAFIAQFVRSEGVYVGLQSFAFKQKFLKYLSRGYFLSLKNRSSYMKRKLSPSERQARSKLNTEAPCFIAWLHSSSENMKSQGTIETLAGSLAIGGVCCLAVDQTLPAGGMFLTAIGILLQNYAQAKTSQTIIDIKKLVHDVLENAQNMSISAISVILPEVNSLCAVTKSLLSTLNLALIIASIAVGCYAARTFIQGILGFFGYQSDSTWRAHGPVAPSIVAAGLLSFVGCTDKAAVIRNFNALHSAASRIQGDLFSFDSYKGLINQAAQALGASPPFKLFDVATLISELESQYLDWTSDVSLEQKMVVDKELYHEMSDFTIQAQSLSTEIRFERNIPSNVKSLVTKMAQWGQDKLKFLAKNNALFSERPEPTVLSLIGRPGDGKTEALDSLCAAVFVATHGRAPYETEKYVMTDTKYFDGYTPSAWRFHIPEFLGSAFKEKNVEMATKFRDFVGTDVIPLPCAALEKKDTVSFSSTLITESGNRTNFNGSGLNDPAALARRYHFPLSVKTTGNLNEDLSAAGFDKAWVFSVCDHAKRDPSQYRKMWHEIDITKEYKFSEVVTMVTNCIKSLKAKPVFSHYAAQNQLKNMRLKSQGSSSKGKEKEDMQDEEYNNCILTALDILRSLDFDISDNKPRYIIPPDSLGSESVSVSMFHIKLFVKYGMLPESLIKETKEYLETNPLFIDMLISNLVQKTEVTFEQIVELPESEEEIVVAKECELAMPQEASAASPSIPPSEEDSFDLWISDEGVEVEATLIFRKGSAVLKLPEEPPVRMRDYKHDSDAKLDLSRFKRRKFMVTKVQGGFLMFKQFIATKEQLLSVALLYFDSRFRDNSINAHEKEDIKEGKVSTKMAIDSNKFCKTKKEYVQKYFSDETYKSKDPCAIYVRTAQGKQKITLDQLLTVPFAMPVALHGTLKPTEAVCGHSDRPLILYKQHSIMNALRSGLGKMSLYAKVTSIGTYEWMKDKFTNVETKWTAYVTLGLIVGAFAITVASVAALLTKYFQVPNDKTMLVSHSIKGVSKISTKKKTENRPKMSGAEQIEALSAHGRPCEDALRFVSNYRLVTIYKQTSTGPICRPGWMAMINGTTGLIVGHMVLGNVIRIEFMDDTGVKAESSLPPTEFRVQKPDNNVDVAVVYFATMIPGIRDISNSFVDKQLKEYENVRRVTKGMHGKVTGGCMLEALRGVYMNSPIDIEDDSENYTYEVNNYYVVPDPTARSGDCSELYVALVNGTYKIVGMHFAGNASFAAFAGLDKSFIKGLLNNRPEEFIEWKSHSYPVLDASVSYENVSIKEGLTCIGKLTLKPAFQPRNSVKRSPLYNALVSNTVPSFPEDEMKPATVRGPTADKTFKFNRKGHVEHVALLYESIYFKDELKDFVPRKLLTNLPDPDSIGLEEILLGFEGMDGLPDNTSPGPVYKRGLHPSGIATTRKKDLFCRETRFISDHLRNDYNERISIARKGVTVIPLVERALKQEARSLQEKGVYRIMYPDGDIFIPYENKDSIDFETLEENNVGYILEVEPREFYPADIIDYLEIKSILWPFLKVLHHHYLFSASMVGINPVSEDWNFLYQCVKRKDFLPIYLDIKSCDKTVCQQFSNVVFRYFNNIFQYKIGSENWFRLRSACWKLVNFLYIANNYLYVIAGSNPSGQWLTCLLNGLWVYFIMRVIFRFVRRQTGAKISWSKDVKLVTFGDDLILSVSLTALKVFNRRTISKFAHSFFGVVFTSLEKIPVYLNLAKEPLHDSWSTLEFLQRTFSFKDSKMLAPLRKSSIWTSLVWSDTNFIRNDPIKHYQIIIEGALFEAVMHGDEFFEELVEVVKPRYQAIGGFWKDWWNYQKVYEQLLRRMCRGCYKRLA